MEDFEDWSKQWWFPEQTWSLQAAVSINLTFGRKDVELISSIIRCVGVIVVYIYCQQTLQNTQKW